MIVDASVAFKWMFVEQDSDAAAALIGRDDLFAPTLMLAELGNALWKKARRGEIGDRPAFAAQLSLAASLVTLVDAAAAPPLALQLAIELDHPIYDCVYLALAIIREDVVVTADEHFAGKVARSRHRARVRELSEEQPGRP